MNAAFFQVPLNERQPRIEWRLILAVVGLMAVGAAFVFSSTQGSGTDADGSWIQQLHWRQGIWYLAGTIGAVLVCLMDYRSLSRFALVIYWLSVLVLVLVLIPGIGSVRFGARRWIDLGFFQFQPSEFAKLAFILVLAHFLSRPAEELRLPGVFLKALGLTLIPFLLTLKEPDLGSSLIFLPVGLVMMFVAGVPTRFLGRLVGGVGLLGALLLVDVLFAPPQWQIQLEDYQRRRLLVYFDVDYQPLENTEEARREARIQQRNDSYNVVQALISVGSGGFSGKGWTEGTQNALGYLPRAVAHNDFIFSVIAEEKGFLGCLTVIVLYSTVMLTGIKIAGQARDRLGKILATGVVTLFFSQVFVNIGMNIRIVPVTGVPLPLVSYGGSSVLGSLLAIGILQNVYLHRKNY